VADKWAVRESFAYTDGNGNRNTDRGWFSDTNAYLRAEFVPRTDRVF